MKCHTHKHDKRVTVAILLQPEKIADQSYYLSSNIPHFDWKCNMEEEAELNVMSLSEFSEYCSKQVSPSYIYSTENQQDGLLASVSMVLRFDSVIINLKPNRICFLNGESKICFNGVKEIQMLNNNPMIGVFFRIICCCGATEYTHTMILD